MRFAVWLLAILLPATHACAQKSYKSRNFLMHSDLDEKEAKEMLTKLEKMLGIISKYWGRRNPKTIEMWVVKNLQKWPPGSLDPNAIPSLRGRAGITFHSVRVRGGRMYAKARAYAYYSRGTPLHEAVHAYCGQAFGTTGPLWYSEGMAELGSYWIDGSAAVNAPAFILKYLRTAKPKSLNEIVNAKETTGDSWQNYAWRWALCHLLATNKNYAKQFRPLGLGLLTKRRGYTFERIYGPMAEEIVFEYKFFLSHLEPGFRCDLCSWNWKAKFRRPLSTRALPIKINAQAGWQPSKALVQKGGMISVSTEGTWTMAKAGKPVSAAGDAKGTGKLVGIVMMKDYTLSDEFDIGESGEIKMPEDGKLFLRAKDAWGEIADNTGSITVRLKR